MKKPVRSKPKDIILVYAWMLPAMLLVLFFLVLPTINTVILSFMKTEKVSEAAIRSEIISSIASTGGRSVSDSERLRSLGGFEAVLDRVNEKYGIGIKAQEIGDGLSIRGFSELVTMAVYTELARRGDLRLFAGLDNYIRMFSDGETVTAFRNNGLWLFMFTFFSVGIGIAMARLISMTRIQPLAKTVIFIPMSISYVASGVIWTFMYDKDPNLGTVNAIARAVTGFISCGRLAYEPIAFLGRPDTVNYALIVAALWIWCGFCVVIFTAALNGIPVEVIEASKIDGAGPFAAFFRIEVPLIAPTIAVVTTTMIINVLKVFDIVYTMTGGGPSGASEVVANRLYSTAFIRGDVEYASAMAVMLFMAIVPVMIVNIRNFIRLSSS